jgi:hypothetical protein
MARNPQRGDLAIFYGDKRNDGQYDNGVWMDLLDIPFIQRIEEAKDFKTVIRTLWLDAAGWSKEIRSRYPEVVQVGLSDHPLSTHISRLPADKQLEYISDLQFLDGLMALTSEERSWYKSAVPSIPVIKAGLPFPVEKYETKYGHLRESPRDIIGIGVGAADNDRNFISNLLVFRELRRKNPNLVGVFLSIPHQLMPYCTYMADNFDGVYIHQRENMNSYMEFLARCKLVISMADRNTPGRIQGEAAFFKIPVVGSDRLELQTELYPDLAVKPFDVETAVDMAHRVINDSDESEFISAMAFDKLVSQYDYEPSRKKFEHLLERIRGE